MRDVIVTLIVMIGLPFIFTRPWVGILMWCWIAFMNPHRMGWGFAYSLPFAALIGACTLVSFVVNSKERRGIPINYVTISLMLFVAWLNVTPHFAVNPHSSWTQWSKVMKIHLMNFIMLMTFWGRDRLTWMLWVMTGSLMFFGIKGGIHTILTAGGGRVYGPPNSYISGNNELAVALIVTVPLMTYFLQGMKNKWARYFMLGTIFLSLVSAVGSQSRGAFLAIFAILFWLWLKSSRKLVFIVMVLPLIPLVILNMPDKYMKRMETIQTYDEDASAMGRINAWVYAYNLANDRFMGAGFSGFTPHLFALYAPVPEDVHDAHSIYFKILGEHGWVGLLLYLNLLAAGFFMSRKIVRLCRDEPELNWAARFGAMVEVSMIGFLVGGSFLGLSYWDYMYHLLGLIALVRREVDDKLAEFAERTPEEHLAAREKASTPPGTEDEPKENKPGSGSFEGDVPGVVNPAMPPMRLAESRADALTHALPPTLDMGAVSKKALPPVTSPVESLPVPAEALPPNADSTATLSDWSPLPPGMGAQSKTQESESPKSPKKISRRSSKSALPPGFDPAAQHQEAIPPSADGLPPGITRKKPWHH